MKQIFIFSLPRSGSTMLQRVLMSHKAINSYAEPWLLLPQVYALKKEGHLSEYGSLSASRGINDIIKNLPEKEKDYYTAIRNFITEIQSKLTNQDETYFLDKTPRYYLIISEIEKIFPDAKFIFLFRSPEQVYASMLKTWGNGRLRHFLSSYNDLVYGYKYLSDGYDKLKHKSIAINYEKFVSNPEDSLTTICQYLEIDFDESVFNNFTKQNTKGRLGDPTGVKKYQSISQESLNKWEKTFNTRFKKRIAAKTINKIDNEALITQGYHKKDIIDSLDKIKIKGLNLGILDLWDYNIDLITRKLNLQVFFSKDFKWSKKKYLS